MKIKFNLIFIISFFVLSNFAISQNYIVKFGEKIPGPEGHLLNADIYMPEEMDKKMPTLFILTPYGTDGSRRDGKYFAENDYVVVIVDVRGRGNSEGEFAPFENDADDGFAVCNWIEKQPWSNGSVGMLGGSYLGMVQWLTAAKRPKSLKTIVPTATVCPGIDFPKFGNIYYTYNAQWLTFVYGKTLNRNAFLDHNYWNDIFMKHYLNLVPYFMFDKMAGIDSKIFKKWLNHPLFDDYYKSLLPSENELSKLNIPVLTITGHYDDDQPGTLYYYRNFMNYAPAKAKDNCHIIIGPWNHGGTRRPDNKMGDLTFSENAKIDMNKIHVEWFDWVLKSGEKPEFLKDKVACYRIGTDKWEYASSLDELAGSEKKLWLSSPESNASDVFHSGRLTIEQPEIDDADNFIYDPLDTTMAHVKLQDHLIDFSWREAAEAHFPGKLVYHSAPLGEKLLISGHISLEAYISMDVPDTDFEAILYEITADGKIRYLSSGIMRSRHRNSTESEDFAKPGEINLHKINTFHFISAEIPATSRLRLVFGALNSPYYQKNYNLQREVSFQEARNAKVANIKLHSGKKYPSKLILQVQD